MRAESHHGFHSPASLHCATQLWDQAKDLISIAQTLQYLNASGWYWGPISAGEARTMLQDTQEGTFLVRDSSHPQYRLTLSVKTGRGPTNVRIEYSEGQFRLDSSKLAKPRLQAFPDVPSLVQHYVKSNRTEEDSQGHTPSPTPATAHAQGECTATETGQTTATITVPLPTASNTPCHQPPHSLSRPAAFASPTFALP